MERHPIKWDSGSAHSDSETGSQAGEVEFVTFIAGEPVDDFAGDRFAHRGAPGGT